MKFQSVNVPLLLPEYGRNVQEMVKFLLTLDDRDHRNRQAQIVVQTMSNVYPHAKRDTVEFRNMLFDHLFMISGFQLDIDYPFDKPDPEQFSPTPSPMPYSQKYVAQKQYGTLVRRFAREISLVQDEQTRCQMGASLAKFMRQKSYDYNDEFPSNEMIVSDLYDMSDGRIELDVSIFDGLQINTFRARPKAKIVGGRPGGKGIKQSPKRPVK